MWEVLLRVCALATAAVLSEGAFTVIALFLPLPVWHEVAFTGCEIEVVLTREGVDGDTTCG